MFILDGIVSRNLVSTWFLQFAATLDRICYSVFGWVLQAIFDIANSEIVSETVFESFEDRVYIILGIFMLFKVTVSLLGYLVNPDQLADKEKGMGKMVTRTIVVLIMLIGFPVAFRFLNDIQQPLLEALPRIIIGKKTDSEALGGQMTEVSEEISWQLFQLSLREEDANIMMGNGVNTVTGATQLVTEPDDSNKNVFKYFYIPFVGMVIAIISTVLLVGIAIDVAIRAFKLIILRMMAPIPIISYIDPKSSKDGAFASWVKAITSTWLDLFIKLGILYFVIYLLDYVIIQGNLRVVSNIGSFRNTMVIVFLIIGLLFFARQAPRFISKALGIKEGGGMGIGLGGMLAGAGAFVGGAGLAGALSASTQAMNENADAAAQGKAGTAGWSKGSDVAAQLRTGDSKAKGGLINNFSRNIDRNAQQRSAARILRSNFGITKEGLKAEKDQMISLQNEAKAMSAAYQRGETTYQYADAKGNVLTGTRPVNSNSLAQIEAEFSAHQNKYQKGSKIAEQFGLEETPIESYQSSAAENVKRFFGDIRHPIQAYKATRPDRQNLETRILGKENPPSVTSSGQRGNNWDKK